MGYYYEIYDKFGIEQDGGLLEYSDNEENETLMSIRKRLAEFTDIEELENENLKEISQEEFDEVLSRQEDIKQAQKVNDLFKAREENGKPLNREEYYQNKIQEKVNYHIDNDNLGEGTPRQKVLRNIVISICWLGWTS